MASNLSHLGGRVIQPVTSPTNLSHLGAKPVGTNLAHLGGVTLGDTDLERGFFGKIAESFERGQTSVLANVGVYEALENPDEDIEGALRLRRKTRIAQALDPVESNWLTDIVYSSAKTAGQMWEAAKRGGTGAIVGGAIGAGVGLGVGAIIPTIGEEPVTAGAGFKVGAKLGAAEAVALFSYREGVGGMYGEMIEQGVDENIANQVARVAGIPYALIETLQLRGLTPSLKVGAQKVLQKTTLNILGKAVKKYGTTLSKEVLEEVAQEIVQIGAEDLGKYLSKQDIHVNAEYLQSRAARVLEVGKEATKGFALLPLPGAAFEAGISMTANQTITAMNKAEADAKGKSVITVDDVNSPTAKLNVALEDSLKVYSKQTALRGKEKGIRAGEVRVIREEIDTGDWLYKAKSALKGQYSKLGIVPLQEVLPVESYDALMDGIRTNQKLNDFEAVKLGDALKNLYEEGEIFRPHEIKYAREAWGDNIANQLLELRSLKERGGTSVMDYLSLPKATAASMDLSRTGRQNVTMIGSPKTWFKGLVTDWNLLLKDESTARTLEKDMLTKLDEAGDLTKYIRWNRWGEGAGFITGTERFATRFAGKIPGVARSERAYAMGGNLMRGEKMLQIAEARKGKYTSEKEWKDIGHVIDILTGEGDAKALGRFAPVLNAVFFAPRLAEARIRTFTDLMNPRLSWAARKVLMYHMASFTGLNLGILGMMSMIPGVNVERDWRSTDFGKIRIGNQRIDFWGGYLPMARLFMRLAAGELKTQAGRVIPADWRDTITTFLQSKLGPAPAYVLDIMRGQTFYGDYVGLDSNSTMEQFYHRFVPFVVQDMIDAVKYQGWKSGLIAAPLAFHGVGVQTYPASPGAQLMAYKNKVSQQILGQNWDELGPEIQEYLREEIPEITQKERQHAFDKTNFDFLTKIAEQNAQTRDRIYKALPADIRDEFDSLNLKVSGINRKIASNWFLNNERFNEYENLTKSLYKDILTDFIRSDLWRDMPPEVKIEVATKIMDEVKKYARQEVINNANMADLERIQR